MKLTPASDAGNARIPFRSLPLGQRFALVRSLVNDRQQELVLAYKNMIRVAYGYKTKGGDARGRGSKLVAEPCVVFVVGRKWRTPGRATDPQKLPATLKATWVVRGKPVQFDVPTDVRAQVFYGTPRPRAGDAGSPWGLKVLRPNRPNALGAATCLLQRANDPDLYVLSCRHVFSRTRVDDDNVPAGLVVTTRQLGTPLAATTAAIRGPLQPAPAPSLDAQIARVKSKTALAPVLAALRFGGSPAWARNPLEIGDGFYIATPRVGAGGGRLFVWVEFKDVGPMDIPYPLAGGSGVPVRHGELIFGHAEEPLEDGDSGSPAVRTRDGDRLVGMFIASQGKNVCCIPAWDLLDPANYGLNEAPWRLR